MVRGKGARGMRRQLGRMLEGMDVNAEEVPDVREVVIRTERSELVIERPVVTKMGVGDKTMYSVTGDEAEERELDAPLFSDGDIDLVCQQSGVGRERASEVLAETDGDIAQAIMRLSND